MNFGPRRPSAIIFSQAADNAASTDVTFANARAAGDLIIVAHRRTTNTNATIPAGFNSGDTYIGTNAGEWAWGIAAGGETVFSFGTGSTNNRTMGIAYKGNRISQVVQASAAGTGTGTVLTFPALTLQNPGRSWVVGLTMLDGATGSLGSGTTAPAWRAGNGTGNWLNIVDSNGPVQAWSGVTLTIGASFAWRTWSIEVMSL